MPSLSGLGVVDVTMQGAPRWLTQNKKGIKSLHIICDKDDPFGRGPANLYQVSSAL